MSKYKEILRDNINAVTEEGDVVPLGETFDNDIEIEFEPEESTRGASVELGRRAVGLMKVMDAFNQQSKLRGIKTAREYDDFNRRYGHRSEAVVSGVAFKAREAAKSAQEAVDELSAVNELVEAGFSERDSREVRRQIKETLESRYGPGVGSYESRKKVTKKAARSAIISKKTK